MPSKNASQIPLPKALTLILLSLLIISGGAAAATYSFFRHRESLANDSRYDIVAIVQNSCDGEWLKTSLLAELLQLSTDRPTNLYGLDTIEASRKLLECPIFKWAEIRKIKPGTVHIEYALRQPVAYLGDYSNTALDDQGVIIPFKPFYTPKNIPVLIVGISAESQDNILWGSVLEGEKAQLASSLLHLFKMHYSCDGCQVRSIDISKAFETSYGQREIVISLVEHVEQFKQGRSYLVACPRTLRVAAEHYHQQLADYLVLRSYLNAETSKREPLAPSLSNLIIDMRIPQLAFLSGQT